MSRNPAQEGIEPAVDIESEYAKSKGAKKGLFSSKLLQSSDYAEQKELLDNINLFPDKTEIVNLVSYLEKMERLRVQMAVVPKMHDDLITYAKIILKGLDPRYAKKFEIGVLDELTLFLEKNAGARYPTDRSMYKVSQEGNLGADGVDRGAASGASNLGDGTGKFAWIRKNQKLVIIILVGILAVLVMSALFQFERGGLITIFVLVFVIFWQFFGKSETKTG
ncbi:MAG: hypothetical protein ACTSU5_07690 [Promethearchaeota archaeon]